jgi:DNA-binding XRE family transcriptional regulator
MSNENSKNNKRNYRFIQKPLFNVDTIDRNKKEFDLNNQMQSEEKNDITIIDDPELHLHLNDDIKKYLQDSIQKQVEEKVQKSLSQIQNELDNTTLELNTLVEVVKTIVNDSGWYEDDSTSGTKYILNSGLFSGTGGLKLNSYSDFKKRKYMKNNQLKVRVMRGNEVISQNYDEKNADEIIEGLQVECNLAEVLKEKGISQAWLADKLGVTRNTILNIINKPNSISYLNVMKISLLLEEPVSKLFPLIDNQE